MKQYVVATVIRIGDNDLFGDIILITPDQKHARTIKHHVKKRGPLPGLDYSLLQEFDDVIYFEREQDKVIVNQSIDEEVR